MNIEILGARKYYSRYATGSVLLINGNPVVHLPRKECEQVAASIVRRKFEQLTEINDHTTAAQLLVDFLGTPEEQDTLTRIALNHERKGHIEYADMVTRDTMTSKYHKLLNKMYEKPC